MNLISINATYYAASHDAIYRACDGLYVFESIYTRTWSALTREHEV